MSSYGSKPGDWNCTNYPDLQANPDIGGIGMLVAFLATAYITFLCCIAKARIDHIREASTTSTANLDKWSYALGVSILSFSDQQVVTGISIIIAGLSQLRSGLDVYHWQTVANLAWFSAFTHIATLTSLRREDRHNKSIRKLRILMMGIFAVMLICVLYSIGWLTSYLIDNDINDDDAGYDGETVDSNYPAWCLYHIRDARSVLQWVPYNWLYVTLSSFILVFSYITRVIYLYSDGLPHFTLEAIRLLRLGNRIPKMKPLSLVLSRMGRSWLRYRLLRCTYAMALAAKHIYSSTVWEFTWLLFALVWGTVRAFEIRLQAWSASDSEVIIGENQWAFGQVVTLALLILPFVGFFELWLSPPPEEVLRTKPPTSTQGSASMTNRGYTAPPNQTGSPPKTPSAVKAEILSEPWFPWLQVCWYLNTVTLAAYTVATFAAFNGERSLVSNSVTGSSPLTAIIKEYAILMGLDLVVMWIFTLIFIDRNVRTAWRRLGLKGKGRVSQVGWTVVVCVVLALSIVPWVLILFAYNKAARKACGKIGEC